MLRGDIAVPLGRPESPDSERQDMLALRRFMVSPIARSGTYESPGGDSAETSPVAVAIWRPRGGVQEWMRVDVASWSRAHPI